ncbi:hypothetical protein BMS3Abin16_00057 [archaeon BMS3Abin16]|nr:hypothetical protein BMS3Abin16_00057 [archaeon BMS3Abin16]HDY74443.1 hypothetical protein [Euryarchaeota archaeon]
MKKRDPKGALKSLITWLQSEQNLILSWLVLVILFIFTFFYVYLEGETTPSLLLILGLIFFLFMIFFKLKKLKLQALFSLLGLFFVFYLCTFTIEVVPYQGSVYSSINLQGESNVSFEQFDSYLIFDTEGVFLEEELRFRLTNRSEDGYVLISFDPPDTLVKDYNITIQGERRVTIRPGNGSPYKSFPQRYLVNSFAGQIVDNDFTPLGNIRLNLSPEDSYIVTAHYTLEKVLPSTNVVLSVYYNGRPGDVASFTHYVLYNSLHFECLGCITKGFPEGSFQITSTRQDYQVSSSRIKEKPFSGFKFSGEKTSRLGYLIQATNRRASILRSVILAVIAGIVLMMLEVIFFRKETSEKPVKSFVCEECGYESDSQQGVNIHKGWKHKKS